MEDEKSFQTEDDIYFKKYIKINQIEYYSQDNLIDKKNNEDLICPICYCILKEPINCSDNKNSHSFCKICIDKYLENKDKCPTCKLNFEYKINNEIYNKLNKLLFECVFKNEGCNEIISYSEYLNHINNCKYNNMRYECAIKKYNYERKEFEECGYIGNKINMNKHFKLCGYNNLKCKFCNENIYQMNLEEHIINKCKFVIINDKNCNKYIGEKSNNIKDGYGIYYYSNGDKYEGEFKNNIKEGYGILYCSDGFKYEGEFKNGMFEGYGIIYFSNGNKYEGEFKNAMLEGYGIFYFSNGDKLKGIFKNDFVDGYGIFYSVLGFKFKDILTNLFHIEFYSLCIKNYYFYIIYYQSLLEIN